MQTFDQSIFSLYQQGLVTLEEALRWASNVDEFKLKVQGISTTADMAPRRDGQEAGDPAATVPGDHPVRWITAQRALLDALRLLGAPRAVGRRTSAPGCSIAAHPPTTSTRRSRGLLESGALDDERVAPGLRADGGDGQGPRPAPRHARAARDGHRRARSPPRRSPRCSATSTSARSSRGRSQKKLRGRAEARRDPGRVRAGSISTCMRQGFTARRRRQRARCRTAPGGRHGRRRIRSQD